MLLTQLRRRRIRKQRVNHRCIDTLACTARGDPGGQVAQALATAGVKLAPDIVAGRGSLGGGTLVDVLLASVIRDRNGMNGAPAVPGRAA